MVATVFVALEEVKRSAARGKQNGVAWFSKSATFFQCFAHGEGIGYRFALLVEEVMQLLVVQAHIDQSGATFAYQLLNLGVVIAFVLAAQDEHGRCLHRHQGVPTRVDVGGLRVVDVLNAIDDTALLQTMFDPLERHKRLSDSLFLDARNACRDSGSHGVVEVVRTRQWQFVDVNVDYLIH